MLIGGTMIFDEHITNYDINVTNKVFENASAQIHSIYGEIDPMRGDLEPEGVSSDSALDNLIGGAYNSITKIWQMFSIMGVLVNEMGKAIGIPAFIMDTFIIIVMVLILFYLVYLIFRFQPR